MELLLVVALMVSGLALAARSREWIGTLLQPPSPAGVSAAIWLVKDITNASTIQSSSCRSLALGNVTYSLDDNHLLTRRAPEGSRFFPGIACLAYNTTASPPILRIYSDRFPGSCSLTFVQALNGTGFRDSRCEYEEQAIVARAWSAPSASSSP